jgi:glycosyltransferase involved in cell wall biosynthesis
MKQLRLLHIYQSPSFSGAESYALEIASFHANSHDVTFLAKSDSPLHSRLTVSPNKMKIATKIQSLDLGAFDLIVLHSTQELRRHWFRIAIAKFKTELKREKPPVVSLYTHIWISHSKRDPLHAIPYSVLDQVWCGSVKAREALVKFLPVRADRIKVVRYGRDISRLTAEFLTRVEARERLQIPADATVIGTLARVDTGKGSRELFEAVTDLMQSRADVHLLMIGPPTDGDPEAATLNAAIDVDISRLMPAIRSRVHKMGRLENGTRYLKAFDLFVLATYKENFALTLLEAMSAEIPCLATDSGGSPDIVRPHTTGWLFLPESAASLREVLMTALDQGAKWHEFGANGRALVTKEYDFARVMLRLEQTVIALVDRRPPVEPNLE